MDHHICCRCGLAKTAAASCICKHTLSVSGRIANNAAQPDDLQVDCSHSLANTSFCHLYLVSTSCARPFVSTATVLGASPLNTMNC
jgi:hypothetical protein